MSPADSDNPDAGREALEQRIHELQAALENAKRDVQSWNDTAGALSRSAAEARAKNQSSGRGFLGGLLGPKYQKIARSAAAASNAAIANDVAVKRAQIAAGKLAAREAVQALQAALKDANSLLKSLDRTTKRGTTQSRDAKAATGKVELLHKLKEAHVAGLLTDTEYEEKRRKLVSEI